MSEAVLRTGRMMDTTPNLLTPVLQAQDGTFFGTSSQGMVRFDQNGNIKWSIDGAPKVATADNGVVGVSGVIYDANGKVSGQENTFIQSWPGDTFQLGSSGVTAINATPIQQAGNFSPFQHANQSGNDTAKQQVSAVLKLHTGVPWLNVSPDDSAIDNYISYYGTTKLGMIIGNGLEGSGCFGATEMVGVVTPNDYTEDVILNRRVVGQVIWGNSTLVISEFNAPDTSLPPFRDDNPQSDGSAGKVYDIDGPGFGGLQDTNVWRDRINFQAWAALPDGTRISPYYNYYVRLSCRQTQSGPHFVTDVSGDNRIEIGHTPLTWNLKPSSSSLGQ